MFGNAYIIFSIGLIGPFQAAVWPSCFATYTDCTEQLTHATKYIQVTHPHPHTGCIGS